jgi:membrane-bound ClpP family serine protease
MGTYTGIGICAALVFLAVTFHKAENRNRMIILALAGLTFLLPAMFPSSAVSLIVYIACILIGIGCFFKSFIGAKGDKQDLSFHCFGISSLGS